MTTIEYSKQVGTAREIKTYTGRVEKENETHVTLEIENATTARERFRTFIKTQILSRKD